MQIALLPNSSIEHTFHSVNRGSANSSAFMGRVRRELCACANVRECLGQAEQTDEHCRARVEQERGDDGDSECDDHAPESEGGVWRALGLLHLVAVELEQDEIVLHGAQVLLA